MNTPPSGDGSDRFFVLEGEREPMVQFMGRMLRSEYDVVNRLRQDMQISKAEVFRRGIRLLAHVWDHSREGSVFSLRDSDGSIRTIEFKSSLVTEKE